MLNNYCIHEKEKPEHAIFFTREKDIEVTIQQEEQEKN